MRNAKVQNENASFRKLELWAGTPKDLFEKLEQQFGIVYAFETF